MNEQRRRQLRDLCRRVLAGDAAAERAVLRFALDFPLDEEPMRSLPCGPPAAAPTSRTRAS